MNQSKEERREDLLTWSQMRSLALSEVEELERLNVEVRKVNLETTSRSAEES